MNCSGSINDCNLGCECSACKFWGFVIGIKGRGLGSSPPMFSIELDCSDVEAPDSPHSNPEAPLLSTHLAQGHEIAVMMSVRWRPSVCFVTSISHPPICCGWK